MVCIKNLFKKVEKKINWKSCESKDSRVSDVMGLGPENLYFRQDPAGPESVLKTTAVCYEGHFWKWNNFIGRYGKLILKFFSLLLSPPS